MIEELIIIGAGGSSQQIAEAVEQVNLRQPRWNLLGFLDDDPAKLGKTILGLKVLGPVVTARQYSARFIIGMANARDPGRREKVLSSIGIDSERFATVIHPSAIVSRHARVGIGTAIMQNVVINQNSIVGDHVIILHNVSIGHDVTIEDFATISPDSVITGTCRIGSGAYIGAGSAINNGCIVNRTAVVGLGSVVTKDVPAGWIVVGNPATRLMAKGAAPSSETTVLPAKSEPSNVDNG
jgi:sugar O-acyltransferase (sialic acid O-acetyltransferase NeuD family)